MRVEGDDVESDSAVPNALARKQHGRDLEFKLIFPTTLNGWNIGENTLAAKNLTRGNSWEFGYTLGASRPLALMASVKRCNVCLENFIAGGPRNPPCRKWMGHSCSLFICYWRGPLAAMDHLNTYALQVVFRGKRYPK